MGPSSACQFVPSGTNCNGRFVVYVYDYVVFATRQKSAKCMCFHIQTGHRRVHMLTKAKVGTTFACILRGGARSSSSSSSSRQ